jgi:uncharacterized protein YcbX
VVTARELRRDDEEISRKFARTFTSNSGGKLWHKHPNASIALVERPRWRDEDTEMGVEVREFRPARKPPVYRSDEHLATYVDIDLK